MMAHYVITIAREKGSGGYDIARKLSDKLNIPFYDRKLLRIASDVSGINERPLSKAKICASWYRRNCAAISASWR